MAVSGREGEGVISACSVSLLSRGDRFLHNLLFYRTALSRYRTLRVCTTADQATGNFAGVETIGAHDVLQLKREGKKSRT